MKNYKLYIVLLMFLGIFLSSCNKVIDTDKDTNTDSEIINNVEKQETILNDNNEKMENIQTKGLQDGDIVAVIKTNTGTIKVKLFTTLVPNTTTNFIGLAKKEYYKDVIFHRVIKDFMIQGGDPTGTGMGGESIYGEKFNDEFSPELKNIKYSISMANAGPNTNGSQFFINQANNSHLDNKHSVFGQVVEGNENVDKIAKVKTEDGDKPVKEIKIISVEIKEYNGGILKDYEFNLEETLKKIEEDKKLKQEAKKDMEVKSGDFVSVHYTGTFEDGEKFDSSLDRGEPIEFQVGVGQMIKGFDEGVMGMKIGDKKELKLTPEMAYGEYDEAKKQAIPKTELKSFTDAGIKLEVGVKLPTQMGELEIIGVDDESVTINTNHPMAGKTLNFEIELIDIK